MNEEKKVERSVEETEKLKRQFQLGMNSYHVGSLSDAPLNKMNNHLFQGDGDYLVVKNRIGNFIVKMREANRPGLPIEFGKDKIELKVPKIPKEIYYQIVEFFKHIAKEMNNNEVFAQVYFDTQEQKYEVFIPEQEVSGASVHYDMTKNLDRINRERYVLVFECHSHNTMGAFWSGTDNADEKETRFFGVIGEINSEPVAEKYRVMVLNKQIDLRRGDIFDFKERRDISFPKIWTKNVKQRTYNRGGYSKGYSYGQNEPGPSYAQYWEDHKYNKKKGIQDLDSPPDGTSMNEETGEIIDIYETFDIENYDEETKEDIIEAFAMSLDRNHIPILMDELVDHGHDGSIKEYYRAM